MTPQNFVRAATAPAPAVVLSVISALSATATPAYALAHSYTTELASRPAYVGREPKGRDFNWLEVRRKLTLFSALQAGWDGQGAPAVSAGVIDRASTAAAHFSGLQLQEPDVTLDPSGEISFVWDRDDVMASLTLSGNGEILAYAYAPGDADAFRHVSRALRLQDLDPVVSTVRKLS